MDDIERTMCTHRLSDAILIDIAIFGKESDDFGDIGRFDLNHQIHITSHPRYSIDSHRHRAGHHVRDIGGIKPQTYQFHEFDLFIHTSMTVLAFSFYSLFLSALIAAWAAARRAMGTRNGEQLT